MENPKNAIREKKVKRYSVYRVVRNTTIILLSLTLGYVHYRYVSHLFENDRNFSHLSNLEREMSLKTEMGFYYSYYKTIVEKGPLMLGISKLMYDKIVEYPKEVNAFNRFNIHPEVIIGAAYKYFEPVLNTSAHRECHMVDRGGGMTPIQSCVGLGEPIMFYLEFIWAFAGLTVAALFLFATTLSESILGGLMAVAQYFANHAECTRVQWAPNERENMAFPLLLLQGWLVTMQLRDREKKAAFTLQVSLFLLNCLCLLFWQFSQFIFLTQTAIVFVMEQLKIIDLKTLAVFLHSHFCGLHMGILLLQGNDMLQSSAFTSFFVVVSSYCLFFGSFRIKVKTHLDLFVESWLVVLRLCIVNCATLYLMYIINDFLKVQEDSHIWDILFSKFTNFKSFHTLLYTCSDVFDFLPWSSIRNLCKTFLIPYAVLGSLNVIKYWIFKPRRDCNTLSENVTENAVIDVVEEKKEIENVSEVNKNEADEETDESKKKKDDEADEETDDSGIENNSENKIMIKEKDDRRDLNVIDKIIKDEFEEKEKNEEINDNLIVFLNNLDIDPGIFYNISQTVVYGVMAGLIMRLKLLFVPHLCIVSSLVMNAKYYPLRKTTKKYLPFLWVLWVIPLFRELVTNTSKEMSHVGEFSDIQQEQLMEWIMKETSPKAAFAGSMPLMATIMLTTRRPVVTHPHYEHHDARQRAYAVYKVYGKFSPMELYQELNKLKATYLVVENRHCFGRSSKGCSFEDIWDIEVPSLRNSPRLCYTLLTTTVDHFYPVFNNKYYAVFRIHDYSVRYMPRSFDT